jgi:hypothetical protein
MIKNLNPFTENYIEKFKTTSIYQQLVEEYDIISCTNNIRPIFNSNELPTPREMFGNSNCRPTIFSIVPFYFLDFLLEKSESTIYDIGCGWNIFKKYVPQIIGIGSEDPKIRSFHGDIHGRLDLTGKLITKDNIISGQVNSAFSINAIHFYPIEKIFERFMQFTNTISNGGRGFVTFNIKRMIETSSLMNALPEMDIYKLDQYIRLEFAKIPTNIEILVFDLDIFTELDNFIDGNLRIVFAKN